MSTVAHVKRLIFLNSCHAAADLFQAVASRSSTTMPKHNSGKKKGCSTVPKIIFFVDYKSRTTELTKLKILKYPQFSARLNTFSVSVLLYFVFVEHPQASTPG